jgi:hypothetical protein
LSGSESTILINNDTGTIARKYSTERIILVFSQPRPEPIMLQKRKGRINNPGKIIAGKIKAAAIIIAQTVIASSFNTG